jgi:hypothetical protein
MESSSVSMFQKTVKYEDGFIFVQPLCDFFKIDYQNQVSKIKNDPKMALQYGKNHNETLFGDNRSHFSLTKNGFLMWILSINSSTVSAELKENFIQYQIFISEYLFGSAEQENEIKQLISEKKSVDLQLRELAAQKRRIARSLSIALDNRYQYALPL